MLEKAHVKMNDAVKKLPKQFNELRKVKDVVDTAKEILKNMGGSLKEIEKATDESEKRAQEEEHASSANATGKEGYEPYWDMVADIATQSVASMQINTDKAAKQQDCADKVIEEEDKQHEEDERLPMQEDDTQRRIRKEKVKQTQKFKLKSIKKNKI